MLPVELLHPDIRDKVSGLYLRGDYDTAVFQAFKEVEVAVRDACRYPADKEHLGVELMRKAFKPRSGPLTDRSANGGEQQGLCELFSGAMGTYKNPHSHRHVGIISAAEAGEMIVFAGHLLRIVDMRCGRSFVDATELGF